MPIPEHALLSTDLPVVPRIGHLVKITEGNPAPVCQAPACHRRAGFLYVERGSGLRVFRPWCMVHRPVHGLRFESLTPRPRPYSPAKIYWPEEVKCPFCHRKREPRMPGVLRDTCRECRGRTPTGTRGPGRPRIRPPKVLRTTPKHVRRDTPTPVRPTPMHIWKAFPYRDAGRSKTIAIPKKDRAVFRTLWQRDTGHFASATSPDLSRRYPTALIVALWNYWYDQEGV